MASTASVTNNPSNSEYVDTKIYSTRKLSDGSMVNQSATSGDWAYQSLTASATTVVKTGAGQLAGWFCGTATGNITIYDNTAASGTVILAACALVAGFNPIYVSFATGLTIVLSGAGVATACYK